MEALIGLIRGERFASRTAASRRQRAEAKLSRIRTILMALENPQHRYPVIHVTGTSGKGSTSAYVAAILTAAGYRVGLRTSPYLQVATEKLQIGSSLIDAKSFDWLTSRVLDEAFRLFPGNQPGQCFSYAEAWSVLGYKWFADRQVDIAVVEVGAGGRFDTTNVIDPVVSVITSIGLDHVVSLGPTIAQIAWHKAGIIKPGASVVVGELPAEAWSIVQSEAAAAGVVLTLAAQSELPRQWSLGMAGDFQRWNAQVAGAVARSLTKHGFAIPDPAIVEGLNAARLPGRLERMPGAENPAVWIDGAHNADKIAALAKEAVRLSEGGPLPVIVLGVLGTKDAKAIATGLRSAASAVVATEPTVYGKRSLGAKALGQVLTANGYEGQLVIEPDPASAIRCAETIADFQGSSVLVAGSMYLAGQIRRRWYTDEDILVQRTPWPVTRVDGRLGAP